jgi:hypothetical protein
MSIIQINGWNMELLKFHTHCNGDPDILHKYNENVLGFSRFSYQ